MKQFMKPACILIAALLFISTEKCNGSVMKNLDEDHKRAEELERPVFSGGKVRSQYSCLYFVCLFFLFFYFLFFFNDVYFLFLFLFSNVVYFSYTFQRLISVAEIWKIWKGKSKLSFWKAVHRYCSSWLVHLSAKYGPLNEPIRILVFILDQFSIWNSIFFLHKNVRIPIIPYCLGCNIFIGNYICSRQYVETDSTDKSVESLWT